MDTFDLIDPAFASRLTTALLHFVWQGCAVALLAIAGEMALHRAAARWRYMLHLTALVVMMACVPVTFAFVRVPEVTAAAPVAGPESNDLTRSELPENSVDAVSTEGMQTPPPVDVAIPTAELGTHSERRPSDIEARSPSTVDVTEISSSGKRLLWLRRRAPQITFIYFLGCGVLLTRLIHGTWRAHRLRSRSTAVHDGSLIEMLKRQATRLQLKTAPTASWCAEISIPVVLGVLKPMILLPAAAATGLTPEQLQALVTHELAHIRRHDLLVNLLQRLAEALLFFHPAVWFISRRISSEREFACDELVLATGFERLRYADALVRMAELASILRGLETPATSIAAAGANSSEFKRRVLKVLANPASSNLRPGRLALAVAIAGLILGVALCATRVPHSVLVAPDPAKGASASNEYQHASPRAEPNLRTTDAVVEPSAIATGDAAKTDVEANRPDARPPVKPGNKSEWGVIANGLRMRVAPVSAEMKEDVVDLARQETTFETLDDVALAVEIENASGTPVSLRDLRYGKNYGEASGKLNVDWFGQFLFAIDYFDASGKRSERAELIPVRKEPLMSGDALTSTLQPGQSLKMLLRPNRWLSVLSQQPLVGRQRAVVRYRGTVAGAGVGMLDDVVGPEVEFTVKKRGYRPSGVRSPQLGDEPQDDPELEPDITKQLVWGPPVDGLRAALDVVPESRSKGVSHGTKPKLKLVVQNVSRNVGDKPVSVASWMWLSELPIKATNAKGETFDIRTTWYTGITPVVRVLLKPQQTVTFDAGNLGLAVTKERAEKFEDVTHRRLVVPQGKYSLNATQRFGLSFQLKDGDGKVLVPSDADFKAELTSGLAPIDISNEIIEAEIVDAVTGKPVEGTTANFLVIKPKTATSAETTVANLIWGPKSPSKIYFTIPQFPEDIAQRPDRDELEIRFGVGNHPDYENYSPDERIPLKQFFHEGPAQATKILSQIKLTPKKKPVRDANAEAAGKDVRKLSADDIVFVSHSSKWPRSKIDAGDDTTVEMVHRLFHAADSMTIAQIRYAIADGKTIGHDAHIEMGAFGNRAQWAFAWVRGSKTFWFVKGGFDGKYLSLHRTTFDDPRHIVTEYVSGYPGEPITGLDLPKEIQTQFEQHFGVQNPKLVDKTGGLPEVSGKRVDAARPVGADGRLLEKPVPKLPSPKVWKIKIVDGVTGQRTPTVRVRLRTRTLDGSHSSEVVKVVYWNGSDNDLLETSLAADEYGEAIIEDDKLVREESQPRYFGNGPSHVPESQKHFAATEPFVVKVLPRSPAKGK